MGNGCMKDRHLATENKLSSQRMPSGTTPRVRVGHILLTYFSVDITEYWRPFETRGKSRHRDLLSQDRLRERLGLLEAVSLPSVLNQSHQDFAWCILIDKKLPPTIGTALNHLVRPHTNIHVMTFEESSHIENCDWLLPLLPSNSYSHIMTTLLDDDDALPKDYMRHIFDYFQGIDNPLSIAGSARPWQWDLVVTDEGPYGYLATKWHRGWRSDAGLASAGLTLVSKYPEINLSVLLLRHSVAGLYLNPKVEPTKIPPNMQKHVNIVRNAIRERCSASGINPANIFGNPAYFDLTNLSGSTLLVNHTGNETSRLSEDKMRVPLKDLDLLRDFGITDKSFHKLEYEGILRLS
jgi:hypothetical protein